MTKNLRYFHIFLIKYSCYCFEPKDPLIHQINSKHVMLGGVFVPDYYKIIMEAHVEWNTLEYRY